MERALLNLIAESLFQIYSGTYYLAHRLIITLKLPSNLLRCRNDGIDLIDKINHEVMLLHKCHYTNVITKMSLNKWAEYVNIEGY